MNHYHRQCLLHFGITIGEAKTQYPNIIRLISGREKMTLEAIARTAKVVSARVAGNEGNSRNAAYLKMKEKKKYKNIMGV